MAYNILFQLQILLPSSKGNTPFQAYFFLHYLPANVIKYWSNYIDKHKKTKPFHSVSCITYNFSPLTLIRKGQQTKADSPFPQYALCRYFFSSQHTASCRKGCFPTRSWSDKYIRTWTFILLPIPYRLLQPSSSLPLHLVLKIFLTARTAVLLNFTHFLCYFILCLLCYHFYLLTSFSQR